MMLEAMGKRMEEAAARLAEADAETLWTMIQDLAQRHDYPLASRILAIGRHEHWTPLHTALALAYAHMALANGHGEDIKDLLAMMNRPITMNRHCANCLCEDKTTKWGDENG